MNPSRHLGIVKRNSGILLGLTLLGLLVLAWAPWTDVWAVQDVVFEGRKWQHGAGIS
jgi:hypothetical protein